MRSITKATYTIDGMSCSSCSNTILSHVTSLQGVIKADINITTAAAIIEFIESNLLSSDILINEIESIGFSCELLKLTKLHDIEESKSNICNSLSFDKDYVLTIITSEKISDMRESYSKLEDLFKNLNGVLEVKKSSQCINICIDTNIIGPRNLYNLAKELNIIVNVDSYDSFMTVARINKQQTKRFYRERNETILSILLTIPLLIFSMILPQFQSASQFLHITIYPGLDLFSLLLFLLCTPIEWYIGFKFHKKAFKSIKSLNLGMDFLVSTGTIAAYAYSTISLVFNIYNKRIIDNSIEYYETSAVLITMVVLGKFLETYAKGKTAKAINELTNHRARSARLIIDDEVIQNNISLGYSISNYLSDYKLLDNSNDIEIDVSLVQRGDCLRLINGESIPADGILTIGTISVDESMLTGESKSVIKEAGSTVYGGTIVVEGSGNMIVTACGDDSALGKIISAVHEAQSSRPPIQELADKIARYFVPVIAFISLLTFFVWVIVWASGSLPLNWYSNTDMNNNQMMLLGTNNGSSSHGNPILFAFFFALAVWVSACPCSFGLATPTAILVSTGLAAKYGILIRKGILLNQLKFSNSIIFLCILGAAIQHITEANVIAFDKTGTLTLGQPNLTNFYIIDSNKNLIDIIRYNKKSYSLDISTSYIKYILTLLVKGESRSNHPIAQSILNYCTEKLVDFNDNANDIVKLADDDIDIEIVPGLGIKMILKYQNKQSVVYIGSYNLMINNNVSISSHTLTKTQSLNAGGKIVIYISIDNELVSIISLSDTVRPEAYGVITTLRQRGYKCYMITGDEYKTAIAIGNSLGFTNEYIYSNTKPYDKESIIKSLQNENNKIIFVGDGTNDTPAMARANVSIAMSSGTDIAIESGDIIFCKNSLESLPVLLDLSKQTMNRIYINYIWALGYNIILIPLAAGIFYPTYKFSLVPMLAGIAMALSSVSVVTSSLLLSFFKPNQLFEENNGLDDIKDELLCNCPTSTSKNKILKHSLSNKWWNSTEIFTSIRSVNSETDINDISEDIELQSLPSPVVKERNNMSFKEIPHLVENILIKGCGCSKENCKCSSGCGCSS